VTNPYLRQKIQTQALRFCRSTNETTSKRLDTALALLRQSLAEGLVEQGDAVPELRKRVSAIFEGMTRWKAHQIAVTEASRAVHSAQIEADVQSEVVAGLELLLSSDACDLCRKIYNECRNVRLGHAFAQIGHDPDYSLIRHPPLHPHCQCSVIEILKPEFGGPKEVVWSPMLWQPQAA
jgi:hypothetical protein